MLFKVPYANISFAHIFQSVNCGTENMNINMEHSARCAPLIAEESPTEKRYCSVYVITGNNIKAHWQLPILEGESSKISKG